MYDLLFKPLILLTLKHSGSLMLSLALYCLQKMEYLTSTSAVIVTSRASITNYSKASTPVLEMKIHSESNFHRGILIKIDTQNW